ncbi:MAG: amidohydrolase [Caldilineaceae bacterium]|nr:amidohydrolase [Caldilineaceae bacterium]
MTTYADILIINSQVYTVDPACPQAEAVAIQGHQIVFVGSSAAAQAWRGPHTEVIDGGGATLLPGLIDSHFHLLWGALKLDHLQLDKAKDPAHFAELLRAHAAAHPELPWLEGVQVRYSTFSPEQPLDRHFLDALVPDRPLYLTAFDGHTVWVNTEALRRGGLLHGRDLPAGHEIVLDPATGLATGELREPEAFKPIRDQLPKPDRARQRTLLRKGLAWLASLGITSVHNMDSWEDSLFLYKALEADDELTLRVYVPYSFTPETPLSALQEAAAWPQQHNGPYVRTGAVKLFMDGVLESTTALMVDPYADAPTTRGGALFSAEQFQAIAREADRLGLQIAVHACGDGAVQRTLDGYAYARQHNGPRDSRHRIEHIEVIHPADIPRFAALGVIASMQPLHSPITGKEGEVWQQRAGAARWPYSFAWATLRQAGATLAFGSDWPVVTADPRPAFYAALNRQPWLEGQPTQRQTLPQVIAGYTCDAAYTEFQENSKGRLRVGMLADLVLFSDNLFTTAPEAIAAVRPVVTICHGKIVFR